MDKKVSIILTHYNQWKYIFEALDSIAKQTYKNIEIIITDDCSEIFDRDSLVVYLEEHNFNNYQFLVNESNMGTVKVMVNAIKHCSGDYILMFAADDALGDENFILETVETFEKNTDINVVSSKCLICEDTFDKIRFPFPSDEKILEINGSSAEEQYKKLIFGTIVAIGATCFRAKELKKRYYLKTKNKYIEDWEIFLKLALKGNKVIVNDVVGLCHRGGGISENKGLPTDMKLAYLNDFENIFNGLIFPYLKRLDVDDRKKILDYYCSFESFYDIKLESMQKHIEYVKNNEAKLLEQKKLVDVFLEKSILNLCSRGWNIVYSFGFSVIMLFLLRRLSFIYLAILIPLIFLIFYIFLRVLAKVLKQINFKGGN